jgi:hypothetical protein
MAELTLQRGVVFMLALIEFVLQAFEFEIKLLSGTMACGCRLWLLADLHSLCYRLRFIVAPPK